MAPTEIPQLHGLPFIGSLRDFQNDRLNLFLRTYHTFGDLGGFRVGPWPVVMLNSAEHVQTVLVKYAEHVERPPRLRAILRPMVGGGLLTSENDIHKRQRRLVAPALQHRRISSYADTIASYTEQACCEWQDAGVIDVTHAMMQLTLRIVGKALFGTHIASEATSLGQALVTAMHYITGNSTTLAHLPTNWPTPRNRQFHRSMAVLNAAIDQMIQDRRRRATNQDDLLSLLLQAQYEDDESFMTDQQVHDEAITLFLAGYETMATALTWTWSLVARHPAIYAQMREEVDRVLAGRTPEFADCVHLPYTLQVLKEAMRLYPPVYILARYVTKPIPLDDYCLMPGLTVGVSAYVLHRRPDYFSDPERFDPDRWTPEASANLPRPAYLPFGAGPHNCIGYHFAMMEGHLILATLAQRVLFELESVEKLEPELLMTLRPKGPITMVVRRRSSTLNT